MRESSASVLAVENASRSDTTPSPPFTTSSVVVTAMTFSAAAGGAATKTITLAPATTGAANVPARAARRPKVLPSERRIRLRRLIDELARHRVDRDPPHDEPEGDEGADPEEVLPA